LQRAYGDSAGREVPRGKFPALLSVL